MPTESDNTSVRGTSMRVPLWEKSGTSRRSTWWGKMPAWVLIDPALEDADIRVFGMLALKAKRACPIVSLGTRWIAGELGWSHTKVVRSIDRLIKAGHVAKLEQKRGRRGTYELTSWVYKNPVRIGDTLKVTLASGVTVQPEGEIAPPGSAMGAPMKSAPRSWRQRQQAVNT